MNKSYSLRSFLLGLLVLAALLIQSVHSFHHLEEDFAKPKCHHHYAKNQKQFTHSHEVEHCFVCEFAFSNFNSASIFNFECKKKEIVYTYSFFCINQNPQFFKGSLFSLRGPPSFIV
jgi:hypothetical protein